MNQIDNKPSKPKQFRCRDLKVARSNSCGSDIANEPCKIVFNPTHKLQNQHLCQKYLEQQTQKKLYTETTCTLATSNQQFKQSMAVRLKRASITRQQSKCGKIHGLLQNSQTKYAQNRQLSKSRQSKKKINLNINRKCLKYPNLVQKQGKHILKIVQNRHRDQIYHNSKQKQRQEKDYDGLQTIKKPYKIFSNKACECDEQVKDMLRKICNNHTQMLTILKQISLSKKSQKQNRQTSTFPIEFQLNKKDKKAHCGTAGLNCHRADSQSECDQLIECNQKERLRQRKEQGQGYGQIQGQREQCSSKVGSIVPAFKRMFSDITKEKSKINKVRDNIMCINGQPLYNYNHSQQQYQQHQHQTQQQQQHNHQPLHQPQPNLLPPKSVPAIKAPSSTSQLSNQSNNSKRYNRFSSLNVKTRQSLQLGVQQVAKILVEALGINIGGTADTDSKHQLRELISYRFYAYRMNYSIFVNQLIIKYPSKHITKYQFQQIMASEPFVLDERQIQCVYAELFGRGNRGGGLERRLRGRGKGKGECRLRESGNGQDFVKSQECEEKIKMCQFIDKMRCFVEDKDILDVNKIRMQVYQLNQILPQSLPNLLQSLHSKQRPQPIPSLLQSSQNSIPSPTTLQPTPTPPTPQPHLITHTDLQQTLREYKLNELQIQLIVANLCLKATGIGALPYMWMFEEGWVEGIGGEWVG